MNVFTRREVFLTRKLDDLVRVRSCLEVSGIRYSVKVGNLAHFERYRGMPNLRAEYIYEYHLYVHKNDLDLAKHAIGK